MDQCSRIENPEINPHTYGQLTFDKGIKKQFLVLYFIASELAFMFYSCAAYILFFLVLFIILYSRFLLVIYFIHISVYMSIPISQFIPPPPLATFPPWCPYVCSLLCLYFCLANWFICTIFLDSTYMC